MIGIEELQKALDNRPAFPLAVKYEGSLEQWFADFEEKFAAYRAELELPVGEWLTKNAKTLSDLFWENNIEWNEWLRMGVTEAKQIALAPKYQGKWGSVDEIQPRLMKLVQERDDNKLLVIQAVTKLRAKEEQLEGKVLVDRKQLSDKLEEYKKIDKTSSSKLWVEGARWVIEFIEKELLASSGEHLHLSLAFADVRKTKKGSGDKK